MNAVDLCPAVADPGQADLDGDGVGDACDDARPVTILVTPQAGGDVQRSHKTVMVTVLSSPSLDAGKMIDQPTLRFGLTGTEASWLRCDPPRDVNRDGRRDLPCWFSLERTKLGSGAVVGRLTGRTRSPYPIAGVATFRIR